MSTNTRLHTFLYLDEENNAIRQENIPCECLRKNRRRLESDADEEGKNLALYIASRTNDIQLVEHYLSIGASVSWRCPNITKSSDDTKSKTEFDERTTAIEAATYFADTEVYTKLLTARQKDKSSTSLTKRELSRLLALSILRGNEKSLDDFFVETYRLLQIRVHTGVMHNRETAMYLAMRLGACKIAEVLLRHGADVNLRSQKWRFKTPLHAAIQSPSFDESFEVLRQARHPIDIYARDSYGNTILHDACELGASPDVIQSVLKVFKDRTLINSRNRKGLAALHFAVQREWTDPENGLKQALNFLTDANADIDTLTTGGHSTVSLAMKNNNAGPAVELLLQLGATPRDIMASDFEKFFLKKNPGQAKYFGARISMNPSQPCGFASIDPLMIEDTFALNFSLDDDKIRQSYIFRDLPNIDHTYSQVLDVYADPQSIVFEYPGRMPILSKTNGKMLPVLCNGYLETACDELPSVEAFKGGEHFMNYLRFYLSFEVLEVADTSTQVHPRRGLNINSWGIHSNCVQKLRFKPVAKVEAISWVMVRKEYGAYANAEAAETEYQGPIMLETRYFISNWDSGWIPSHGLDFICRFIFSLLEKWKKLFSEAEKYLDVTREVQRQAKGEDPEFVYKLLSNSEKWEDFQTKLRDQRSKFNEISRTFQDNSYLYEEVLEKTGKASADAAKKDALESLKAAIKLYDGCEKMVTKLQEDTKALIELEFGLSSIYETHSMSRLNWITFIFLPLTFTASLFGMNVDIFANNPRWTSYIPFSVVVLLCAGLFVMVYKQIYRVVTIMKRMVTSQFHRLGAKERPEVFGTKLRGSSSQLFEKRALYARSSRYNSWFSNYVRRSRTPREADLESSMFAPYQL